MVAVITFAAGVALLAAWERLRPLRAASSAGRVLRNIALFVPVGLPAVLAPLAIDLPLAGGWLARQHLPWLLEALLVVLLLDLVHYAWHRAEHHNRWLWRLHRVHHSDGLLDVSTAVRFHPTETLARAGVSAAVIGVLGPSAASVLTYAAVSQALNVFNHANVLLPASAERWLGRCVVTPALHRVHHGRLASEQGANLGSIFACWDVLFGTRALRDGAWQRNAKLGLDGAAAERIGMLFADPWR